MNCAKAQSLMLDHLYGDLRPSSERALLRHLQECSKCSEEFEAHKATASSFAKLDMEKPPPGLSSKLVAIAEEDIERQKSTRTIFSGWNWKPAFASVAMAALAILIVVKYVPDTKHHATQYLDVDSNIVPASKEAPMAAAPRQMEFIPRSEISTTSEGEATIYPEDFKKAKRRGHYVLDKEGFGDDISAGKMVSAESKGMVGDNVGGKAGADEAPDVGRLARAQAPQPKEELRALGLVAPSAERSGRKDSTDDYSSTHAGEEGSRTTPVDTPAKRFPVTPMYAAVNGSLAAETAEPPVVAEPQSMPSKPVEKRGEESIVIGGSIFTADSLERERDRDVAVAQEQQIRKNGLFDAREFDQAVIEAEKAPSRKVDRQLTAKYSYNLGRLYQQEKEYEKAIAIYETIVAENPNFDGLRNVYISMGKCYLDTEEFEQARRSFELALDYKGTGLFAERDTAAPEKDTTVHRALLYEYASSLAHDMLEDEQCNNARAVFDSIAEDSSKPLSDSDSRAKFENNRSTLSDVYFSLNECYVETGRPEKALYILWHIYGLFPEKQEKAAQRMIEITATREAAEKANEQPPSASVESSMKEAE